MALKTLMERLLELESTRTIKYFVSFFPLFPVISCFTSLHLSVVFSIPENRSKSTKSDPSTDVAVHQTATCRPGQRSPQGLCFSSSRENHLSSAFVGDSWMMYPLPNLNLPRKGKSLFISPILWGLLWVYIIPKALKFC